jgi:hypothetical protein
MFYMKSSLIFTCYDACLVALTEARKFSVMMLDDKMFYFTIAATVT